MPNIASGQPASYYTTFQTQLDNDLYALSQMAAPQPPTNVAASDGTYTDKVLVTWTAPANATAYEVWRNTSNNSGTATKISSSDVIGTSYSDTTATAGTTYWYWVKAKNASETSGVSAGDSGYRLVSTPPVPAPPTPSAVTTTTVLTASPNPAAADQSVTFTATVSTTAPSNGTPTGTVTFTADGKTPVGAGTLSNGKATVSTTVLGVGTHTITASYPGGGNFAGSIGSINETVEQSTGLPPVPSMSSTSTTSQRVAWLNAMAAYARFVKTQTGNSIFVSVQLAQAALETGWGTSTLFTQANNFGGVKGVGDAGGILLPTQENVDGRVITVMAQFRKYSSLIAAFTDQALVLDAARYATARSAKTPEDQIRAIAAAGYATDPNYATKIIRHHSRLQPKQYDVA